MRTSTVQSAWRGRIFAPEELTANTYRTFVLCTGIDNILYNCQSKIDASVIKSEEKDYLKFCSYFAESEECLETTQFGICNEYNEKKNNERKNKTNSRQGGRTLSIVRKREHLLEVICSNHAN
ncbi:hypothetical protein ScPMuIL_005696 [Solemya velum]